MDHIILEGFVGCGKGAVGKKVAKDLSLPVIEVDKLVSEKVKMTPADIYDRFGELYFRALETVVLSELKDVPERSVIILGSGLPLMAHNDAYLDELGRVYWLRMSKAKLIEKLKKGKKYDWMKDDDSNLQINDLLRDREEAYDRIASEIINVDEMTVDEVAAEVERLSGDLAGEAPEKKIPEEEKEEKEPVEDKPAKKAKETKKTARKTTEKKAEEKTAKKTERKTAEKKSEEKKPAKKKSTRSKAMAEEN